MQGWSDDLNGWRRLAAACILRAVEDAQRGDVAAGKWLETAGCELGAGMLGIDAAVLRNWQSALIVKRVRVAVFGPAERRRRKAALQRRWYARKRAGALASATHK